MTTSNIDIKADKEWWRGTVIYQIYPRSYQDSNGDGIGDMKGITSRLPHIANLGADAIWISPFFTSPMLDFGYDVSDYCDVDPIFGTLADFDEMIAKAHDLGLKVMIDLVLSHTSNQHPWFTESQSSKDNDKSDWYVWADPKLDANGERTEPNNWLSIFGGSAWQWHEGRGQFYLHNFLVEQPDLNLHNKEVQDELLNVARFWMDKGVDGFRLDTINFYFHDQQLRDNPVLPVEMRNDTIAPSVNPYNHFEHLYDKNQPENIDFLKRFRACMDEYPAVAAVGEVGDAQRGMEIMAQYTKGNDLMQMCYAFEFLSGTSLEADRVKKVLDAFAKISSESWSCWAFSNHDVARHKSRWNISDEGYISYLKLILSLRGSVCLYQGEELGLTEADVAFEDLQDPYGKEFWPKFKGRDGCRTPMVWEKDAENGGFSSDKPWLPVSNDHLDRAADQQVGKQGSYFEQYKAALAFRKSHSSLIKGELEGLTFENGILSFIRRDENETILCAFNLSDETKSSEIKAIEGAEILSESGAHSVDGTSLSLPAWQVVYAKLAV